jgi:hypothetical protein
VALFILRAFARFGDRHFSVYPNIYGSRFCFTYFLIAKLVLFFMQLIQLAHPQVQQS